MQMGKEVRGLRNKCCRLCGISNPSMLPIFATAEPDPLDNDVNLDVRIILCTGIEVQRLDGMSQMVCSFCFDRVSDFFEFRQMCKTTDDQMREVLHAQNGISPNSKYTEETTPPVDSNELESQDTIPEIEFVDIISIDEIRSRSEPVLVSPEKHLQSNAPAPHLLLPKTSYTREQKRIADVKKRSPKPAEPPPKLSKVAKSFDSVNVGKKILAALKQIASAPISSPLPYEARIYRCIVCSDVFFCQKSLNHHLTQQHIPNIYHFGCGVCSVGFKRPYEFEMHKIWHKKNNIPHLCLRCKSNFLLYEEYAGHQPNCSLLNAHKRKLLPEIQCTNCKQYFHTQNLYLWHECFVKANTICQRCGDYYENTVDLLHHIYRCSLKADVEEITISDDDKDDDELLVEIIDQEPESPDNLGTDEHLAFITKDVPATKAPHKNVTDNNGEITPSLRNDTIQIKTESRLLSSPHGKETIEDELSMVKVIQDSTPDSSYSRKSFINKHKRSKVLIYKKPEGLAIKLAQERLQIERELVETSPPHDVVNNIYENSHYPVRLKPENMPPTDTVPVISKVMSIPVSESLPFQPEQSISMPRIRVRQEFRDLFLKTQELTNGDEKLNELG